ncbi:hypothetical protein ANN_09696 [Periplaneta americana]|uniref:DUF4817 domain-containing protein n=1 Tax=Periplaneta americana TaxID=6978 RepID=A0ABQ8TM05_PERAM|nr:hypothetical protein ANN_09696 [Periplaneta americana]
MDKFQITDCVTNEKKTGRPTLANDVNVAEVLRQNEEIAENDEFRRNYPDVAVPNNSTITRIIARFRDCGSVADKKRTGRPATLTPQRAMKRLHFRGYHVRNVQELKKQDKQKRLKGVYARVVGHVVGVATRGVGRQINTPPAVPMPGIELRASDRSYLRGPPQNINSVPASRKSERPPKCHALSVAFLYAISTSGCKARWLRVFAFKIDNAKWRCLSEIETLPHILGFCPYIEALRNIRHHAVRSMLAEALKEVRFPVHQEVQGLATQGSVRRIDIIAIKNNSAYILDPTIRFETHADQPHEVDSEKKRIYEPTIKINIACPTLIYAFVAMERFTNEELADMHLVSLEVAMERFTNEELADMHLKLQWSASQMKNTNERFTNAELADMHLVSLESCNGSCNFTNEELADMHLVSLEVAMERFTNEELADMHLVSLEVAMERFTNEELADMHLVSLEVAMERFTNAELAEMHLVSLEVAMERFTNEELAMHLVSLEVAMELHK